VRPERCHAPTGGRRPTGALRHLRGPAPGGAAAPRGVPGGTLNTLPSGCAPSGDRPTRPWGRRASEELARISPRERDVALLIAAGLTNAEIAQQLTLVEGTVANHVEHALRKLGLRSRTQIAVWAVEHGLYRSDQEDDEPEQPEPPTLRSLR
jgi:DNA-binding CsgD family transcriptional regulator